MKPTTVSTAILLLVSAASPAQPPGSSAPIQQQLEWQRREIQRMQDDAQRQRLAQQRAAMEAQRQADEAQRQADEAQRAAARRTAAAQPAPTVDVPTRPSVQPDSAGRAWLAAFIRRVQADPRLDAESKRRIIDDTLRRAGY